ncbi:Fic family protein [Agromyces sp. NBRC 114283]|jgi:Fic family protein|uniref:Fic family protein n=1 Tax=Agromyces sp. NBRC 114283 TaxID=2994521 RepID=UPI0024A5776B|nr:Fic family protein [Agromyces sp. NBRC 114283]
MSQPTGPTAVSYEERPWTPKVPSDVLPATVRATITRPYEAAVTPRIADLDIVLSEELAEAVQNAQQQLVRFDAEVGAVTAPFASILLRSESASSSQIENLTSGARAIAEAELGERVDGNAPLIVSNVRAMEAAVEAAHGLDHETIIAMHRELLKESDPGIVGRYRTDQVWIGGGDRTQYSPHGADFVPPHHERVEAALDDLIEFSLRPSAVPLASIAVAHAQFETIHPFPDGNGRTGRALVQSALRRSGLTRSVTVPISAGILQQRDRYFAALDRYREGDVEPIVGVFADGAVLAVVNGRQLLADIQATRESWEAKLRGIRSDAVARRIADLALEHPVLNSRLMQDRLPRSGRAIFSAIGTLVDRGILTQANSRQRNRIWVARDLIANLDAFAERSRRS